MLNRSLRLKTEYMGAQNDVVSQHTDRMIRFHEQAGQPEKADALRTR